MAPSNGPKTNHKNCRRAPGEVQAVTGTCSCAGRWIPAAEKLMETQGLNSQDGLELGQDAGCLLLHRDALHCIALHCIAMHAMHMQMQM